MACVDPALARLDGDDVPRNELPEVCGAQRDLAVAPEQAAADGTLLEHEDHQLHGLVLGQVLRRRLGRPGSRGLRRRLEAAPQAIGGQEPGGRRGGRQREVGHGHPILAAFAPASSHEPLPRVAAVVQAQELHGLADDVRIGGQAKGGLEGCQEGAEATGVVLRLPRDLTHEALEVVQAVHGGMIFDLASLRSPRSTPSSTSHPAASTGPRFARRRPSPSPFVCSEWGTDAGRQYRARPGQRGSCRRT